jgi:methylenetetrahydrofolate dehydrogenase (NADP+) / methenyltetrahydrofolate cyclohydrolase
MAAKIIDGNAVAEQLKNSIREELAGLKLKYNSTPQLVAVQAGENPASKVYVKNQKQSCEEVGIQYLLHQLPEDIGEEKLIEAVEGFNRDAKTTGIILQMPLPNGISPKKVQMKIAQPKDVEGLTPASLGMLIYSETKPLAAPCTALAVIELLKSTGIPLKGKETVVVGHSEIVGKPVTLFLLSSLLESATPTVCHIATKDLAFHTRRAEILIVAVGKAGLVKGDMIGSGSIVIDVGINRVPLLDDKGSPVLDDKGKPKKKTVGDVVYEDALQRASYVTPVPGGVGPVTTMMLLRNTMNLWKNQLGII